MEINMETTCRICLGVSAMYNIFSSTYRDTKITYCEMINVMFSMSVSKTDGLPSKICRKCHSKVSSIYKFRCLAQTSLENLLKNKKDEERQINAILKLECIKQEVMEINNDNISIDGTALLDFDACLENDLSTRHLKNCSILEKGESNNFEISEPSDFQFQECLDHYDDDEDHISPITAEPNIIIDSIKIQTYVKIAADKTDTEEVNIDQNIKCLTRKSSYKKQTPLICPKCGKSVVNMRDHIQTHNVNRKKLACPDCPKTFCTYGARRKHRDRVHFDIKFFCKICQKKYAAGSDHIRLVHSDKEKKFSCIHCDKKFHMKGQLDAHTMVHTKERPFKCQQCGKGFRSQGFCNQHVRKDHDMERSHLCHFCSKKFFRIDRLNAHIRSHLKEKIYKCKICDKMFASSSTVREHEKKHSGIKKFKCDTCQSNFFTRGALIAHMISHTKEKKHACKYCGIKFGRTDHRNRHQQTAHEMKLLNTKLVHDLEFSSEPRIS